MQNYSFYYRDTLNLKLLFPDAFRFKLLFPHDNVYIEDGIMGLRNPELFDPSRIHNTVCVYTCMYDYYKISVSIRCWKYGKKTFREVTPNLKVKQNKLYRLVNRVIHKFKSKSYNTLLCSHDDYSLFINSDKLIKISHGGKQVIGKIPKLVDPLYYQFIVKGEYAFYRTGGKIFIGTQGLSHWKLIYEGKRAIKDSMVWIESEHAVLFTEYSTGVVQSQHKLFKYYVDSGKLEVILTFYTTDEHNQMGLLPFCRHIHVLQQDPYSGNIYLGTGDTDDESAIYRSTDNGNTFQMLGHGSQLWRTLSFLFTETHVLWNTDSPDPQYITALSRTSLNKGEVELTHYPIYGGASWNTFFDKDENFFIMSSNLEGALFDSMNRVYAVQIIDGKMTAYCLFEDCARNNIKDSKFSQLFVLGKDCNGAYWFYDTRLSIYRQFIIN